MAGQRSGGIFLAGDMYAPDGAGFTARHRDFGTYHIGQLLFLRRSGSPFGNGAQTCGTFGDNLRIQRDRIVGAWHGGIQMDLAKSCGYVFCDQDLSFFHRACCGFVLPAVRPQMVATQ
ncbi:hypothetical protein D3C79_960350 [compost metagenome]